MPVKVNPFTGQLDLVNDDTTGTPGGGAGALQFNDGGSFGGFGTFNDATDETTLPGAVTATDVTATGTVAGNAVTATTSVTAADLTATDDLSVGDDAQITGDLNVDGETTVDGLGVDGDSVFNGETSFTNGQVTFESTAPALFSGKMRLNSANMALADGDNDAVTNPNAPMVVVTGPTAAFAIRGITPGANAHGQFMVLLNMTGQAMTLTHEAGGAASAQLRTSTGADIVTTANGFAILVYNVDVAKWIVVATSL